MHNRTIYGGGHKQWVKDLKKGDIIREEMLECKRPEEGLSPEYLKILLVLNIINSKNLDKTRYVVQVLI